MATIKCALSIIPPSLCIGGAIYMAVQGVGWWGFLLFAGVIFNSQRMMNE